MSITPRAIQDLLDELEFSKQSRLRGWNALQRIRLVLADRGVAIGIPPQKTFDAEGSLLENAVLKSLSDREAALKTLADAARRLDKAAFGKQADFPQAHQALLTALDHAEIFIQT
jgi:hypothetical protein